MEADLLESVFESVKAASVNVQVEWSLSYEGEVLINLRATPWRNSSRPNRMILVGSLSLEEAFTLLADELDKGQWVNLDWRARVTEAGVYEPEARGPRSLKERGELLRHRGQQLTPGLYEPTGPDLNGA